MNNLSICIPADFPEEFGVIKIDATKTKTLREFYEVMAEVFEFPDYFGFNLDSFDEMINDLSWIEDEKLAVFFENSESFLINERNETKIITLLDMLDATCEDWKWMEEVDDELPKKSLLFGFSAGERIQDLLNKLS